MNSTIKVMTLNARVAVTVDEENSFWERKPRLLLMIQKEDPDIIGFQEATDEMRSWFQENLKGYTTVGCGREKDYHGESVAVAFKNDVFQLLSMQQFWLSPTPDIPGSRFTEDQSPWPRLSIALKLYCDRFGAPFVFLNTHLDVVGKKARYQGMLQNVQYLSCSKEKFIYTGDMNITPDSAEIKLVTEALGYRGVIDCTKGLGPTYHGYGKANPWEKIDYIFTDGICEKAYVVEENGENGLYYSDHFAVCAYIKF